MPTYKKVSLKGPAYLLNIEHPGRQSVNNYYMYYIILKQPITGVCQDVTSLVLNRVRTGGGGEGGGSCLTHFGRNDRREGKNATQKRGV